MFNEYVTCIHFCVFLQSNTDGLQELACGGLIYCLGVFFFKSDGVIPFAHAIWHMFVALAAAVHYYAIWKYLYNAPSSDTLLDSWPRPQTGRFPSRHPRALALSAGRLPRLPAEAATTAVRFTKTMTVNCLLFSNKENRFLSQWRKATL